MSNQPPAPGAPGSSAAGADSGPSPNATPLSAPAPAAAPSENASAPVQATAAPADLDEVMASLGRPIELRDGVEGGARADGGEGEVAPAAAEPAAAAAPASTKDKPSSSAAATSEPVQAVKDEEGSSAQPTATNSTATTAAAAAGEAKASTSSSASATAAPPASTPAPAAPKSTSAPRTSPSASAPQTARQSQKKKKKPLAALLSAVFFCFPSDDGVYDEKKPSNETAPVVGGASLSKEKSVKKASAAAAVETTPTEGRKDGTELRQITSRELMDVATTTKADKTPKPANATLPVPAPPLNTKCSQSNLEAGGDVVIPPPTPTSPPIDETAGLTSSAVVPPGSGTLIHSHQHHSHTSSNVPTPTSSPHLPPTDPETSGADESFSATDSEVSASDADGQRYDDGHGADGDEPHDLDEEDEDEDAHLLGGVGIPIGPDGKECPLLPPLAPALKGKKCLVLDLDETLLHSSFKLIPQADYIVPVEIESQVHNVYVIKRPGVDNFLKRMGEIYEVVVFTASLSKYADPVLDMLDVHRVVSHRLFRESCYNHKGNYVKDLSQLGRPIDETIIIDNSPASYIFHPNNAVPVSTWFNDPHDSELSDLILFLADLAEVEDVRGVLDGGL